MKRIIKSDYELAQALTSISLLAPTLKDKAYEVEIREYKPKRSLSANSYFHVLVHKIAEVLKIGNDECKVKMNLEYGTPLRIDDNTLFAFKVPKGTKVTDIVKYPKWVKTVTDNGKEVDVYMVYKETHTLNSAEMCRLLDGVIYEAQSLNIETATPDQIAEMKSLWSSQV